VGGTGGASGSGGAGGTGGGTGFAPCPASGACKVLPLGDSITDGFGAQTQGGYRIKLFELAVADGKAITFVGNESNGPTTVAGQPFPQSHEGHSGWVIQKLDTDVVPSPALDDDPHIILLHIGTNDMWQGPSGAPDRLATLLDELLSSAPEALLVVAKIIPFPGYEADVDTFNAAIPGLVEARASAGKHIVLVDQFTGFDAEGELADGVHPNAEGYARMANTWYAAISSHLR
jgi:lysophospholipase L1-like esterase